jgi:hypothetical protein
MIKKCSLIPGFALLLLVLGSAAQGAGPFQQTGPDGLVIIECEDFDANVSQGGKDFVLVTDPPGFSGTGAMQSLPNSGTNVNTGYVTDSPRLDYKVNFTQTGTHYVWLRANANGSGSDDSAHSGLDGEAIATADRIALSSAAGWTWTNSAYQDPERIMFEVTTPGLHTFNLYMREDGGRFDKVVLTTNPDYTPTGMGPAFAASNPLPANGAQDVTSPLLQWVAGVGATMHQVYIGTTPDLGPADAAGPPQPVAMYFHIPGLTPGVTYYWRVDEIAADGTVVTGPVWSFTVMPLEAHAPSPADGATEVSITGQLQWAAGQGAMAHMVYLSTDKAAVQAGNVSAQVAASGEATYDYAGLTPFTTYYWRVDEVSSTGQTVPGPVWSFSTPSYLLLNEEPVTLNYNNSAAPSVTQVELTGPANWTIGGLSDLTLQFTGRPASFTQTDTGITVIAAGADIYQQTDEFCYVCKKLIGDGSITVRVDRLDLTNAWAKAGVMIRENLSPAVRQVHTIVSGSNGIEFQYRPDAGANTTQFATTGGTPPLPQWVRLTRAGDTFTGETSSDGQTWTQIVSGGSVSVQDLVMAPEVYIGLAVTSHVAGTTTTAQFSNITTTGDVSGDWLGVNIAGSQPGNSPADLYAAVEDAAGKVAVVQFGDPAATTIAQPWSWKIPLSAFASVDLKNVARLYLGAGDLQNPVAGGNGIVTFDNVSVILPVVLKNGMDVTAPGDNVLGVPNDGVNTGGSASGWPAAETPPLAIDDNVNTKFLHFKGEKEPTGFQVQVMAGPTLVTGLTFTTANDAPERDPVSFELSGSNDGLAGPWTLIASGDIVDFAGATAWPRFTKNTTPITFENQTAYKFYQVMFPAVRDPASANSMQIAEVELIDGGANVMWVSDAYDDKPDGIPDDQGWIDFLQGQGYNVEYRKGPALGNGYWRTLDQAKIDALNAADLVIFSRNSNSGDYNNGNERDQWNGLTVPLVSMAMHPIRSSHWKWFNTTTINTAVPLMQPADPANAIFAGVTLDANGLIEALGPTMGSSFPGLKDAGNGTVLATRADTGDVWIASWAAGTEFYAGAGQIPAGPRVFFAGAMQETPPTIGRGEFNLTDSGQAVFLNVLDMLLP